MFGRKLRDGRSDIIVTRGNIEYSGEGAGLVRVETEFLGSLEAKVEIEFVCIRRLCLQ